MSSALFPCFSPQPQPSTGDSPASEPAGEKYCGSFERSSNSRELALNAIATLLGWAHEVVAVVGHDSQHVFAMQNEVREDHREGSDSYLQVASKAFPSIPNFTAITNPNRKKPSQRFPKDQKSQCMMAKPGKSYYNLISASNWDCLTIR
jgi:hypothetical protein